MSLTMLNYATTIFFSLHSTVHLCLPTDLERSAVTDVVRRLFKRHSTNCKPVFYEYSRPPKNHI